MRHLRIVFDLDDTLIPNRYRFNWANMKCGEVLVRALGNDCPHGADLFNLQTGIDTALVEELGFGPKRFEEGWVRTYREICEGRKLEPDDETVRKLRRAAKCAGRGPFRVVDGGLEVLRQLQAKGHELYLVTVGPEKHQRKKVRDSGLDVIFGDNAHFEKKSKLDTLHAIAGRRPRSTVVVGDSKRSDVAPALELGLHMIWIPNGGTWSYTDVEVDLKRVHRIDSITEVPAVVGRIAGGCRRKKAARKT